MLQQLCLGLFFTILGVYLLVSDQEILQYVIVGYGAFLIVTSVLSFQALCVGKRGKLRLIMLGLQTLIVTIVFAGLVLAYSDVMNLLTKQETNNNTITNFIDNHTMLVLSIAIGLFILYVFTFFIGLYNSIEPERALQTNANENSNHGTVSRHTNVVCATV